MTAKEVTLNYLKSIKRDLENTINRSRRKGEHLLKLDTELITVIDAIEIVSDCEGVKVLEAKTKEIKNIIEKHYSDILSELDEIINVDDIKLSIVVEGEKLKLKLSDN